MEETRTRKRYRKNNFTMDNSGQTTQKALKAAKLVSLGILGVAASIGAIGYAEKFFRSGALEYAGIAGLFTALFLVILVLETLFAGHAGIMGAFAFAQSVSPLELFWKEFRSWEEGGIALLLGVVAFFLFQCIGMRRGGEMLENSLKLKVFQLTKAVAPKGTTGMLIFVSILFYLTYFSWGGWNDAIGRRVVEGAWNGAGPVMDVLISGAKPEQTVDEFLRAVTESEIRKLKTKSAKEGAVEFDLGLLAPEEREARLQEIVARVKGEMEKFTGPVEGNLPMSGAVYGVIQQEVGKLFETSPHLKGVVGIGAALLFFGFLKSFAFLITWLAEIGAFLLFQLCIATGFAEIRFESASRERIEL